MARKRKAEDTKELTSKKEDELNNSLQMKEDENASLKLKIEDMKKEVKDLNKKLKVVDKLKDKLECPVCYEIPRNGPVFVCPNGHIVCSKCKRNICPYCREPMVRVKSLLAETLIENIQHECKYNSCGQYFDLDKLGSHEKKCAKRLVVCPRVPCKEEVPLSQLMEHLLQGRCFGDDKPIVLQNGESVRFYYRDEVKEDANGDSFYHWHLKLCTLEGTNFVLIPQKNRDIYSFPLVLLESEEECSKFKADVEVFESGAYSASDSSYSFKHSGNPCSIDNRAHMKDDGLLVNKVRFQKLKSDNNLFSVSVRICKKVANQVRGEELVENDDVENDACRVS